jgi:hypothetical protein
MSPATGAATRRAMLLPRGRRRAFGSAAWPRTRTAEPDPRRWVIGNPPQQELTGPWPIGAHSEVRHPGAALDCGQGGAIGDCRLPPTAVVRRPEWAQSRAAPGVTRRKVWSPMRRQVWTRTARFAPRRGERKIARGQRSATPGQEAPLSSRPGGARGTLGCGDMERVRGLPAPLQGARKRAPVYQGWHCADPWLPSPRPFGAAELDAAWVTQLSAG